MGYRDSLSYFILSCQELLGANKIMPSQVMKHPTFHSAMQISWIVKIDVAIIFCSIYNY